MNSKFQIRNLDTKITKDVLATVIDVTWHVGSAKKSDASSRYVTIALSRRDSGKWSLPVLSSVTFTEFNPETGPTEANSDPRGRDLIDAVRQVVDN